MRFKPKTEKEIAEEKIIPEGVYGFQISNGEDKTSKAGNEMIELIVRVYKPDGNFILITDYLMEKISYKLRHAAEACGLLHEYESGVLVGDNFVGKTGELKLGIKEASGDWPAKNVIKDYIVPKDGEKPKALPAKSDDGFGDEIPF